MKMLYPLLVNLGEEIEGHDDLSKEIRTERDGMNCLCYYVCGRLFPLFLML